MRWMLEKVELNLVIRDNASMVRIGMVHPLPSEAPFSDFYGISELILPYVLK
jgi:hypothetical protein